MKFLDDLDGQAASLIKCLVEAYDKRKCPFPGGAAKSVDYFCLVRVGLAVMERAAQVPVEHELLSKYGGIFRSLLERLPTRRADVHWAYLRWISGGDSIGMPSNEDYAGLGALFRVGIDDKTFSYFVQEARREIPSALRMEGNGP